MNNNAIVETYLSLGTNLGNREKNISNTINYLQKTAGNIKTVSTIYETTPWGFDTENDFFNSIVILETYLAPRELLLAIKRIEKKVGRTPKTQKEYESRVIDIDIIFYGNQFYWDKNLSIPHRLAHKRKFVLKPLNELVPDYIHPLLELSVSQMLKSCDDKSIIKKVSPSTNYSRLYSKK